jgi:hypothetical protein
VMRAPTASSSSFSEPSYTSPLGPREGASSYSQGTSSGASGFAPEYAPAYAPGFMGKPNLDATDAAPNAASILGVALMGISLSGIALAALRRRKASTACQETYLPLSA